MSTLNIKFADGNTFETYYDDTYHFRGCETCDYGSSYINEISIYTTNYVIEINLDQMYDYAFSTAEAIKMFAIDFHSITEREFIDYLETRFQEYGGALKRFDVTKRK